MTSQPTPSESSSGAPSSSPPSPAPASPAPSPTFTEDLPLTTPPPPAGRGKFLTIRGTIQPGVESGCLILSTPEGTFLLVGPRTANLKAGMTVELSGAPDETIATACQQGTPFVVTQVS